MKRLWGWALLGALSLSVQAAAEGDPPVAGEPTPAFAGTRADGTPFDSLELEGQAFLIDFWGTWCPPCIDAFPKLSRLHEDFGRRGFQVVGLAVLSGTPEEVTAFLADYDVTYPIVLVEREVPDSFDVLQYPSYFLVGADGSLVTSYPSRPGDLYEAVAADLERLLPIASDGDAEGSDESPSP